MADVQLEHGFLRIANSLDEAITYADWSGTHHKIARVMVRLTFGWRQKTVRITHGAIAERCGLAMTGGFRKAFHELTAEGVIVVVEPPTVNGPGVYAVNKNYERWGRFSVAAARLEALFGSRFGGADHLYSSAPERAHPSAPDGAPPETEGMPDTGHTPRPVQGSSAPVRGTGTGSNPPPTNDLEARKDSTTTGKTDTTTPRAREDEVRQYAIGLTTAANNAAFARWGERARTRPLRWDQATNQATEYLNLGIPLDVARQAIADACAVSKLHDPPKSVNYYDGPITDAFKLIEQRQHDAENPSPKARGAGPQRVNVGIQGARVVNHAEDAVTLRTLQTEYDAEQLRVAQAWLADPANALTAAKFKAEADEKYRDMIDTGWGKKAHTIEIARRAAEAAGHPSFEAWRLARAGAGTP